jgi:hypothetical protein
VAVDEALILKVTNMDNASDADLDQLVEDPEDAPLVEAAHDELAHGDKPAPPAQDAP